MASTRWDGQQQREQAYQSSHCLRSSARTQSSRFNTITCWRPWIHSGICLI